MSGGGSYTVTITAMERERLLGAIKYQIRQLYWPCRNSKNKGAATVARHDIRELIKVARVIQPKC